MSHNLIHKRFGSKEGLWRAAVDWGFSPLTADLEGVFDQGLEDPVDQLHAANRRFLVFSSEHPELFPLMNIEGGLDTERLDYIYDTYIAPTIAPSSACSNI